MYSLYSRHVSARIGHHQVNPQNIKKKYYSYNGFIASNSIRTGKMPQSILKAKRCKK
jgi:hypothetical protein